MTTTVKKNVGGRPRKKPLQEQVKDLSFDEMKLLYNRASLFLQPHQVAPPGAWRYHLFMGGRGSGKTYAGIYWLYDKIIQGAKKVAIVGPDYRSVENDLVPLLLDCYPPQDGKDQWYNSKNGVIHLPDGVQCYCYTSTGEIRGPNLEYIFCDEIVKWCEGIPDKIMERFDVMDFSCRIGKLPQIFIASTPKPNKFFRKATDAVKNHDPAWSLSVASMRDNKFISQAFRDTIIAKFGHTRFGEMEIEGKVRFTMDGSLWSPKLLEDTRVLKIPNPRGADVRRVGVHDIPDNFFYRLVVATDPATTSTPDSDLSGLIVAGLGIDMHVYILLDDSNRYTPPEFAQKVKDLYDQYHCDCIVVETNNGGDYVKTVMKAVFGRNVPYIKGITAKHAKLVRARPILALQEQGQVHMVGNLTDLEDELINYVGDPNQKSPDRLDAFVYAVTELRLENAYVSRDFTNLPKMG